MPPFEAHPVPYAENPYAWDFGDKPGALPDEPFDELGIISTLMSINYRITSIVGGSLSLLLLYLVIFRTDGPLKKYRKMLLICCLTDLTFWAVDNFMGSVLKETDGVYIIEMSGPAGHLSRPYRVMTVAVCVYAIIFVNAILPVQLYFRYYALVKNKFLTTMQTVGLSCIPAAATVPTFVFSYLSFATSPEERPGFNYGKLWYRQFPLPILMFGDVRSINEKIYFLVAGLVVAIAYTMTMIIGYLTYRKLNELKDSYTEKTRKLQKLLTNFMIVQVTIPLVISVLPVLFIVVSAFLYIDTGWAGLYCSVAFSWIPLLNPIITITVIVPFRKIVFGLFKKTKPVVHNISDDLTPIQQRSYS